MGKDHLKTKLFSKAWTIANWGALQICSEIFALGAAWRLTGTFEQFHTLFWNWTQVSLVHIPRTIIILFLLPTVWWCKLVFVGFTPNMACQISCYICVPQKGFYRRRSLMLECQIIHRGWEYTQHVESLNYLRKNNPRLNKILFPFSFESRDNVTVTKSVKEKWLFSFGSTKLLQSREFH